MHQTGLIKLLKKKIPQISPSNATIIQKVPALGPFWFHDTIITDKITLWPRKKWKKIPNPVLTKYFHSHLTPLSRCSKCTKKGPQSKVSSIPARSNVMGPIWAKKLKLKRLRSGGRRSIRLKQWEKFTVKYSMIRFLKSGGGILALLINGERAFAIIGNLNKIYNLDGKTASSL